MTGISTPATAATSTSQSTVTVAANLTGFLNGTGQTRKDGGISVGTISTYAPSTGTITLTGNANVAVTSGDTLVVGPANLISSALTIYTDPTPCADGSIVVGEAGCPTNSYKLRPTAVEFGPTNAARTDFIIGPPAALTHIDQNGNMTSPAVIAGAALKSVVGTVAALTTCNSASEGTHDGVTDATSATFLAAAAGGGSNHVPVYCDGTSWKVD